MHIHRHDTTLSPHGSWWPLTLRLVPAAMHGVCVCVLAMTCDSCVGLKLVSEEAASPHKFLCPKCCDELPATDANNEVKAAYPGAWVLPEARDDSFDAGEYLTNLRIVTIEVS